MKAFNEQMEEIARFAKAKGFDFNNSTREQQDSFMQDWIENGRVFAKAFSELSNTQVKSLIKISF